VKVMQFIWIKTGIHIEICLGNKQDHFQSYKFIKSENISQSLKGELLFWLILYTTLHCVHKPAAFRIHLLQTTNGCDIQTHVYCSSDADLDPM